MKQHLLQHCVIIGALATTLFGAEAFKEEWNNSTSSNFYYGSGGNKQAFTHTIGATSSIEPATKVLALATDPSEKSGAWQGPNYTSNQICHFGTYAARIKIPDASSQPNVGAVVGFYTYYNDEYNQTEPADINGNGLYDNSEIDFEWLIADPRVIYITAYTDYHSPTGETRKVGRVLNLAEGTIYKTTYAEKLGAAGTKLTGVENQPESISALPSYDASKQFYTYGFDWHTNSIRWWMLHPDTEDTIVLWDYKGPQSRITQKRAYLMMNIWHTNNWPVITNSKSTEAPNKKYTVEFDWTSYTPVGTPVKATVKQVGNDLKSSTNGNYLQITNLEKDVTTISLYTIQGKLVTTYSAIPTAGQLQLALNALSTGVYFWEVQNSTIQSTGSVRIK